jgi:hypothetical protein
VARVPAVADLCRDCQDVVPGCCTSTPGSRLHTFAGLAPDRTMIGGISSAEPNGEVGKSRRDDTGPLRPTRGENRPIPGSRMANVRGEKLGNECVIVH